MKSVHREPGKDLGLLELIAIALGGMVGGGIFTVLGISVAMIGNLTPMAIFIGGLIAALAAYSYIKLARYYKYELKNIPQQMIAIMILYGALAIFAWVFSKSNTE